MARTSGRALSHLVTAAVTVALAGGTAGTALADGVALVQPAKKPSVSAPVFPIGAVTKANKFYFYEADGKGGLKQRVGGGDWKNILTATQVNRYADGRHDGDYYIDSKKDLYFQGLTGHARKVVPDFGHFYDTILSPGALGGARTTSLLAFSHRTGRLEMYTVKENGTFTNGGVLVGSGKEWGQYDQIAGRGDLTGDGRTDVVARDRNGVLWLYKGTGDARKPFAARVKVGGGWGKYTRIFSNGDLNGDGHSDLLAIDGKGALWLYPGTGRASAPFKSPVKIGNSGWNQYRLVF
ncbi:FG-GAP repeat domain-containing protein [Streptomyces sp. NPDC052396]|uniref:FG-GAP repeat domain-containing protein n=1 Tax=Streptomyces sp. NPDC052396 TaxID=3365689 RepID=UPI0037CCF71E